VLKQLLAQQPQHLILQLHCCLLQGLQIQTQTHLLLVRCLLQVLTRLQVPLLSLQEPQMIQTKVHHQLECQTLVQCLPQELQHQTQAQLLLLVLQRCWRQTGLVCCLLLEQQWKLQSRCLLVCQSRRSHQMLERLRQRVAKQQVLLAVRRLQDERGNISARNRSA
jgi:hypothetical protein